MRPKRDSAIHKKALRPSHGRAVTLRPAPTARAGNIFFTKKQKYFDDIGARYGEEWSFFPGSMQRREYIGGGPVHM